MIANFFYPFTNNSPANQARGVLRWFRARYPRARVLEWDFLGTPRQPRFEPAENADLNFVFDMSHLFFHQGRELRQRLRGPVLVGSILPYELENGPIPHDAVDYQLIVGRLGADADPCQTQIGYLLPEERLRPAKPALPLALIDHWRQGHPEDHGGSLESSPSHTRANYEVARRVLADLHIPIVELGRHNQDYGPEQIFDLYRRCHFFFLTFHECFGLPLLENLAAGNWIIAPSLAWLRERHLADSPGFFSWDWDRGRLRAMLEREKAAILADPAGYAERRHGEQSAWVRREYRHEERLAEVVERCLARRRP